MRASIGPWEGPALQEAFPETKDTHLKCSQKDERGREDGRTSQRAGMGSGVMQRGFESIRRGKP